MFDSEVEEYAAAFEENIDDYINEVIDYTDDPDDLQQGADRLERIASEFGISVDASRIDERIEELVHEYESDYPSEYTRSKPAEENQDEQAIDEMFQTLLEK